MEIPEGVKDRVAYVKYITLSKNPILNKKKLYTCSDGTIINLASFHHVVRKNVSHLKISEQKEVLDLKDEYCNINNNVTKWRRKAFGSAVKGGGKEANIIKDKESDLIDLFGKFHTVEEVTKTINQDWGIPMGISYMRKFVEKHKKVIEEKKETYRASYSDVRLGVKRSRLEELQYLYNLQKEKYNEKPANETYRLLLTSLEQIRKEAEGDRLTVEGKVDISYEVNIQNHLRDEVFSTMNLKEIILGRVAARMGVNPIKLIHSLNNSYYKQFSNVLGDFDPDNEGESIYPSQLSYDFERIGKAQSILDRLAEDAVIEDEEESYADKSEEQALTVKEKLLAKLRAKQSGIAKNK